MNLNTKKLLRERTSFARDRLVDDGCSNVVVHDDLRYCYRGILLYKRQYAKPVALSTQLKDFLHLGKRWRIA